MKTIFMDESGYTGEDLMNEAQPYFCLATLCCSEEKCSEYKTKYFSKVRSPELKHKTLIENGRHKLILDFLEDISQTPELIKILITHKRYALTEKIVQYVVKPAAKKAGIDLRIKGQEAALACYMYYALPELAGKGFFEDLLRRFQKMMIHLNHESYHYFFDPLFDERYPKINDKEKQEMLDYFLWHIKVGHTTVGYDLIDHFEEGTQEAGISRSRPLDVAFPSAQILTSMWRKDIDDYITLIHDKSSRMAEVINLWRTFFHPYPPPTLLQLQPNITARSQVGLQGTYLLDSKEWAGLQLADIIAGASLWWTKWRLEGEKPDDTDEYGNALNTIMLRLQIPINLHPANLLPQYFEEKGLTEEEAKEIDDHIEKLAAFHRLRAYGITYQVFPDPLNTL